VLNLVAAHLGKLRRADLAAITRPQPLDPVVGGAGKRQARRNRLNARKRALTAESSARWASAIIAANDDQYRLARNAQQRHITGLRAAIGTIEKRLAEPTGDTLNPKQRTACRTAKLPNGYATQAERFQKQRRLQRLRAELRWVCAERDASRVHVVEGGKRQATTRHHLRSAGLTLREWRQRWDSARDRIQALGSGDEPFGNLTLTVTPDGEVSLRLPKPLEYLANARHGRYVLTGKAVFSFRTQEWKARITGGKPVSYAITRTPGRAGRYLTGSWTCPVATSDSFCSPSKDCEVRLWEPVVGIDLNDGHLAVRRLDEHGNPVGRRNVSTSTSRGHHHVGMPKSGIRSLDYSATPSGMESTPSPWRTSTSPTPELWAAKRWAADSAVNGSASRSPVFRPRCSAIGSRRRPTATVFAYMRSTLPTQACGVTSIGGCRMRTSPDTRQPPL
jgi:hypothetical protein